MLGIVSAMSVHPITKIRVNRCSIASMQLSLSEAYEGINQDDEEDCCGSIESVCGNPDVRCLFEGV